VRQYYIMASISRTLYTGVTNDLERRVFEHKNKLTVGFTEKYNVSMLVWFEELDDIELAIEWEKRIKGWRRSKKVALIESANPMWHDLAATWFQNLPGGKADPSVAKPPSE
jgi:putative endonuclease